MKLSALAVRRPVTTGMFFLAIVVLGLVSLSRLAVDQLPDVTLPSIPVSTIYEGAAPEIVERLITEPLDKTLATINNIKAIRSFSGEGSSRVSLDFNWGANLDLAALEVHEKVSNLVRWLPDEAEPPRVSKYDPGGGWPVCIDRLYPVLRPGAIQPHRRAPHEVSPGHGDHFAGHRCRAHRG